MNTATNGASSGNRYVASKKVFSKTLTNLFFTAQRGHNQNEGVGIFRDRLAHILKKYKDDIAKREARRAARGHRTIKLKFNASLDRISADMDFHMGRHSMNVLEEKMKGVGVEEISRDIRRQQKAIYGNSLLKTRNGLVGGLPLLHCATDVCRTPQAGASRKKLTPAATEASRTMIGSEGDVINMGAKSCKTPALRRRRKQLATRGLSSDSRKVSLSQSKSKFAESAGEREREENNLCSNFSFHRPKILSKYFTDNLIK